jgi:capsular polysaccharide biosynthesis protein
MELITFLRILLKRWWVFAIIFPVTVISTAVFTYKQTPVYSATATFVVSPSKEILTGATFLSGLSVLGGQSTIANTYALVATSHTIRQEASETLGLTPIQTKDLSIASRLRTSTNVLEISVEGTDPILSLAFANQVGESTMNYVDKLYEVYDIKILDAAQLSDGPVRPNKLLNLTLGVLFGLVLGAGFAFLFEYLSTPTREERPVESYLSQPQL